MPIAKRAPRTAITPSITVLTLRFIEMTLGGWHTHSDNIKGTPRQAAVLEAMRALPADLHAKELLDQTLVVLGTEFGRTPRINNNDGRGHSYGSFIHCDSAMIAEAIRPRTSLYCAYGNCGT